jgi:hypothetical protein
MQHLQSIPTCEDIVEEAYLWEEDVSSTKQKLNTQSSPESEIIGADDFMPAICWTRYFMEAQGYQVQDNILFQDNKSAILLEKNGKASSSKRTKHVNIWYFFITNRVDKGNVSLVWCPTGDMIRDFMTKPLQGALFWKFRDQIMGVVPAQDPGPGKAITKIDELNTHTDKPTKGKDFSSK